MEGSTYTRRLFPIHWGINILHQEGHGRELDHSRRLAAEPFAGYASTENFRGSMKRNARCGYLC